MKLTRVLTQPLQRRLDPFLMLDAFGTDNPQRLHRRLSRPSAPRLRDGHLHDRRPHAPSRQRGPRRPAAERRRAVDDGRPRRHPLASCPSRKTAAWKASSSGSTCRRRTRCARRGIATSRAAEIPEVTTAEGVKVRVIAGASHGVDGAMQREVHRAAVPRPRAAGGRDASSRRCPPAHNAFVYVYRGALEIGGTRRCRRSAWRSSRNDAGQRRRAC